MADGLAKFRQRLSQPVARIGLALAGGILFLDQLTKFLVLDRLNFSPPGCLDFQRAEPAQRALMPNTCGHIELSPVFDLTMVWNKGVSFGLFGADTWMGRLVLITFSLVISLGLLAGLLQSGPLKALRPLQGVAFGCIIGGAIGNAIDRALYGAVVDFLNFSDVYFPYVFNIADVGINLGVAAILLEMLLSDRKTTGAR